MAEQENWQIGTIGGVVKPRDVQTAWLDPTTGQSASTLQVDVQYPMSRPTSGEHLCGEVHCESSKHGGNGVQTLMNTPLFAKSVHCSWRSAQHSPTEEHAR